MDFKVTGTAEGITALQMDIKVQGISEDDHPHRAWRRPTRRASSSSTR